MIIVTHTDGLVLGEIVEVFTGLVDQRRFDFRVVGGIAGVVPVVEEGAEHGASLPPEVARVEDQRRRRRPRKQSWRLSRQIPLVFQHHVVNNRGCDVFDGI